MYCKRSVLHGNLMGRAWPGRGTDRDPLGTRGCTGGEGNWYMVMCKYSPKLQERRYETLEPSERDTGCALVHKHCQEAPEQEKSCWTCPGAHREPLSGRGHRAGTATALCPAVDRGGWHWDWPWEFLPWCSGSEGWQGQGPSPHQELSWQTDSV